MHYYQHHIGDYAQATAHLSMLEDAAYSRMLRWYYAEEKPLPADAAAVCRLVRATSKQEREAVEVVLGDACDPDDDNDGVADVDDNCPFDANAGYALSLDGVNDYVNIPDNSALDISNQITVEAWVRLEGNTGTFQNAVRKNDNYLRAL